MFFNFFFLIFDLFSTQNTPTRKKHMHIKYLSGNDTIASFFFWLRKLKRKKLKSDSKPIQSERETLICAMEIKSKSKRKQFSL